MITRLKIQKEFYHLGGGHARGVGLKAAEQRTHACGWEEGKKKRKKRKQKKVAIVEANKLAAAARVQACLKTSTARSYGGLDTYYC